jgi:hypothetical protein
LEFGLINAAGSPGEHYLEVVNSGSQSVDVSGWKLSGSIGHTFKPGTVVLAGDRLYVSPNVGAFRSRAASPTGGEALFVQGNNYGQLRVGEAVSILKRADTVVATATTPDATGISFAEWIAGFFPAGSPASTPDADPDLDGSNNALEFALANHPGQYSVPEILITTVDINGTSHVVLTFARPVGTNVLYSLEQSTTMEAQGWSPLASNQSAPEPIPGEAGLERAILQSTLPVDAASLYIRLRVVVP